MSLRVVIAHNRYRQPGGEDGVADFEASLLERHGNVVFRYSRSNTDLNRNRLRAAYETVWSHDSVRSVAECVRNFRPDVIHVHNTFPVISPSLYWAAAKLNVPVVQTLHNFRLLCPQAMLLREGKLCELCVGRIPWRGIVHRCYRHSALQSAVATAMLTTHRLIGTYDRKIDRYIALNQFCRDKFIAGGLPADKFSIKPNCADVVTPSRDTPRSGALFVGRLSEEKGIRILRDSLGYCPETHLDVIGDGPEMQLLADLPQVKLHGRKESSTILDAMRTHCYLVMPSIWYENAPRTLIEAFGSGLPVIASRLGALAELVRHGVTGLLFDPGSARSLADALSYANAHPEEMKRMGMQARLEFESRYTPEQNYLELMAIYRETLERRASIADYAGALS